MNSEPAATQLITRSQLSKVRVRALPEQMRWEFGEGPRSKHRPGDCTRVQQGRGKGVGKPSQSKARGKAKNSLPFLNQKVLGMWMSGSLNRKKRQRL